MTNINYIFFCIVGFFNFSLTCSASTDGQKSLDGSNWMRDNIDILGGKKLNEICILGSHDSGMSEYNLGTALAHPCNVLTQTYPIKRQLELGARLFDVRPVIGKHGVFLTGHYAMLPPENWQGGNGQSIKSIVSDLNSFTRNHNELIIVQLSHSLNTNKIIHNYRRFKKSEWDRLFDVLDTTENMYIDDRNANLPALTLDHFTDHGSKAAVVYIVKDPKSKVNIGSRLGKGYFYVGSMNMYHKYSNTHHLSTMLPDQVHKMRDYSRSKYFFLSWTLTQGGKFATFCQLDLTKTILDLANEANDNLHVILSEISDYNFPNVIYVDNIKDLKILEVVMKINLKIKNNRNDIVFSQAYLDMQ